MSQHQLFEYTFPKDAIRSESPVTVRAMRTVTPGLIITPKDTKNPPAHFRGKQFVITHEHTGAVLHKGAMSLRVARLTAGALGGVFDGWDQTDKETVSKAAWEALGAIAYGRDTTMRHWLRNEIGQ